MKSILPHFGRRGVVLGGFILLACMCMGALTVRADSASTNSAATDDEAKAWREVKKLAQPPMPPASWQEKEPTRDDVKKFYSEPLTKAVNAAKDFYTKYPKSSHAEEASKLEYNLLFTAVNRLGLDELSPRLAEVEKKKMEDPNLSEDERFQLRVAGIQRLMRGLPETMPQLEKEAHALQKDFPKRDEVYQVYLMILSESEGEKAKQWAKEILDSPAPDEIKDQAKGVMARLEALGKPLDIAFTALDGRTVDLSKMKGKVVLVDFWATWCGPCMGEVPHVKEAYEKLHPKGFEIVGISFDQSKDALEKTLKEKGMTWPQYFDGEGWKNKFGKQFGINSIPTMWLVDKNGKLADINARGELEEKVTKLLGQP